MTYKKISLPLEVYETLQKVAQAAGCTKRGERSRVLSRILHNALLNINQFKQ